MTKVFQRDTRSSLPVAMFGDGIYLIDSDGKRYLDASCGAAVSCLGHSDQDVIRAVKEQIEQLAFAHTGFFSSKPAEELANFLINAAPNGIKMAYFVSGGSEAIETALKMARQYHVEVGNENRTHFIARKQSYHGNTLGALSVGGNFSRRAVYEEMLLATSHISPCYPFRYMIADETEQEYGYRVANELEAEIKRIGPDKVAAFVAETIGGATAGVLPPVKNYFKYIREICNKYGVLLILDEVMCGMGRTGTLFACEQENISPDIICVAKGLGAGYQPIGATLVQEKIYRAFFEGSGKFQHGHTYMGHPTACAAALAVQEKIRDSDLLRGGQYKGKMMMDLLWEEFKNNVYVGDIRGRGLFFGIELVLDKVTKEPFPLHINLHQKVKKNGLNNGLICYPGAGTANGVMGDHILLAPPFIITEKQIVELISLLARTIEESLAETGL
ncbi:MAG: aspartate aminotransferase family protein [Magnetovibrio sp.]|nr:aspartate aminotransferase family protein [Magnetovibrio sp.]